MRDLRSWHPLFKFLTGHLLTAQQALPHVGSIIEHDDQAIASWTYNRQTKTMVSYDSPQIAAAKVDYIKREHLGGAMWWESSGDKTGEDSLINLVRL